MSGNQPLGKIVKVAAVQAAPVLLDLNAGVEKAVGLIDEAGRAGVQLINFPETWLPGYPWWIWLNPPAVNMQYVAPYFQNSIEAESEHDHQLRSAAARNNIHVVIGVSERAGGSLYMGQWHYGPDGSVLSRRRKLKPTHVERSVYGEGDGSDMIVHKTEIGNIGALCCWENLQPLSKYALFSQDEQIHCAAWPSYSLYAKLSKAFSPEVSVNVNQIYGVEGQCFVLSACSVTDQAIYNLLVQNEMHEKFIEVGGGYARIFGPNGAEFGQNIAPDREGLVIADIDLGLISHSKTAADPAGHYARPDALALMHNKTPRRAVIEPYLEDSVMNASPSRYPQETNLPFQRGLEFHHGASVEHASARASSASAFVPSAIPAPAPTPDAAIYSPTLTATDSDHTSISLVRPASQRFLDYVSKVFYGLGALGILALVLLTVVGVIWRYWLNDPIFGLRDISSMTAALVAACGVVVGAVSNGHITVNIMPKLFNRKWRRFSDVIARALGVAVLGFAASALVKKGQCGLACGNITSNLSIPHAPFYYLLAVALGFVSLYLLIQLYAGLLNWRGDDPNEAVE